MSIFTELSKIFRFLADPRSLIDICTHLRYDFEKQNWTDGKYLEEKDFELKWREEFGGFWFAFPGDGKT